MANQLNINGTFGISPGTLQVNIVLSIATPLGISTGVALASGLNTINIPSGTSLILIQLPPGNTQTVTLKGVTGDTGILLSKTGTIMLAPDPADTTFVLTCGGAIAALTIITFL